MSSPDERSALYHAAPTGIVGLHLKAGEAASFKTGIDAVLRRIAAPRPETLKIIEKIRSLDPVDDREAIAKEKLRLPAFLPVGYAPGGTKKADMEILSGCFQLDIDWGSKRTDNPHIVDAAGWREVIASVFEEPWVVGAFMSTSMSGVCVIGRYAPVDLRRMRMKEIVKRVGAVVRTRHGVDVDDQSTHISKLRFASYDPDILRRPFKDAVPIDWTTLPPSADWDASDGPTLSDNAEREKSNQNAGRRVLTLAEARSLLASIDLRKIDGGSYDAWLAVGMALKGCVADGAGAQALYEEWSRLQPNYEPGEIAKKWPGFAGFDDPSPKKKGFTTLRSLAQASGGVHRFKQFAKGGDAPPDKDAPAAPPLDNDGHPVFPKEEIYAGGKSRRADLPMTPGEAARMSRRAAARYAVHDRSPIFYQGGHLVRWTPTMASPRGALIRMIPDDTKLVLDRMVDYFGYQEHSPYEMIRDIGVPLSHVGQTHAYVLKECARVKHLDSIVTGFDLLRASDGSLHFQAEDGYVRRVGALYRIPASAHAALDDALKLQPQERWAQFRDYFSQIAFQDAVSEANALGATLLMSVRGALPLGLPLVAISKPQIGAAASLLSQMLFSFSSGALPYKINMSMRDHAKRVWDDSKLERKMGEAFSQGYADVVVDNIQEGVVAESDIIASASTSRIYLDAKYKTTLPSPRRLAVVLNGNNLRIARDLNDRAIHIILDQGFSAHEEYDAMIQKRDGGWKYNLSASRPMESRARGILASLLVGWIKSGAAMTHTVSATRHDDAHSFVKSLLAFYCEKTADLYMTQPRQAGATAPEGSWGGFLYRMLETRDAERGAPTDPAAMADRPITFTSAEIVSMLKSALFGVNGMDPTGVDYDLPFNFHEKTTASVVGRAFKAQTAVANPRAYTLPAEFSGGRYSIELRSANDRAKKTMLFIISLVSKDGGDAKKPPPKTKRMPKEEPEVQDWQSQDWLEQEEE